MQHPTEKSEISILAVLDEHNGKEGKKICDKAAKDTQKLRYSLPWEGVHRFTNRPRNVP